jgi:type VI secretion system protein ImpF
MPKLYLPTLLHRLADDRLGASEDRLEDQLIRIDTYRAIVLQDVSRLLNASPPLQSNPEPGVSDAEPGSEGVDLRRFPSMSASVINYGLELPVGGALSGGTRAVLAERIALALRRFEPRLEKVRVLGADEAERAAADGGPFGGTGSGSISWTKPRGPGTSGADREPDLSFAVEAELFAEPVRLELLLRTDVDFVRGSVTVEPWGNRTRLPSSGEGKASPPPGASAPGDRTEGRPA